MPGLKSRLVAALAMTAVMVGSADADSLTKIIEDLGKIQPSQNTKSNALKGLTVPSTGATPSSEDRAQSDKEEALRRFDADQKLQVEKELKDRLLIDR